MVKESRIITPITKANSLIHIDVQHQIIYNFKPPTFSTRSNALAQEPLPQGNTIYNFGRPFLGHLNYTLSLSEPCLGLENKI